MVVRLVGGKKGVVARLVGVCYRRAAGGRVLPSRDWWHVFPSCAVFIMLLVGVSVSWCGWWRASVLPRDWWVGL